MSQDGEEHHDLHLSRGVEGLQTPLYRLPFVEGQYNDTHIVGVHTSPLDVPRRLLVDGGRLKDTIGGTYDLMVTRDGRPKPLLIHGRLVWKRITVSPSKQLQRGARVMFEACDLGFAVVKHSVLAKGYIGEYSG